MQPSNLKRFVIRASMPHLVTLTAVVCFLGLSACSREVEPFEADRRDENVGPIHQVTFSQKDDRSPIWSASGDSLFYVTQGGGHLPPDSGVIVGIPVVGGVARTALRDAQLEGDEFTAWLAVPALAPDADRLGFAEIVSIWEPHPCDLALTVLLCDPTRTEQAVRRPPLRQVAIHVRRFDESAPLAEGIRFDFNVPGVEVSTIPGPPPFEAPIELSVVHDYPFQQLFSDERDFGLEVSWAPDGGRVVFSDGLRLLVWEVGGAPAQPVPGTEDGIWPAWSPDGAWIAFTRLERADSSSAVCDYSSLVPICRQERTDYVTGSHLLSRVRPDGSESQVIGEGDEPAWSPDGSTLFFRSQNRIWRSGPDGSNPEPVENTENGREPSVSPDGGRLAFARLNARGDHDIWIIPLPDS